MQTQLDINDYTYDLPQERIALYPLEKRDHAKLLTYNGGNIQHHHFFELPTLLPENTLLIFNNTKVIPARLLFQKDTGAIIEIFLLNPITPSPLLVEAMNSTGPIVWKCTIGNLKRWTSNSLIHHIDGLAFTATLINRQEGLVEFRWNGNMTFAEVVTKTGEMPLPPYLKRKSEKEDRDRYQTVYSKNEGAVAAPTAGLHFTPEVLNALELNRVKKDFVTLHVSAGTFQPVKTNNALDHVMHQEQVVITKDNIKNLIQHQGPVIPVGTTSMRTLESIYWYGVKLCSDNTTPFIINQQDPYVISSTPSVHQSLEAVLTYMNNHKLDTLIGETSIYIVPGYTFKICKGIVTNFHQPSSTLILLIAALIGEDWRKVYRQALNDDYRFLSYGDSSLLLPS